MNRIIFGGSLASVIFLIIGTYVFADSPIMWLASTSVGYTIFRSVIAVLLIAVLLTNPPRKLAVRALMGLMAAVMVSVSGVLVAGNSMHLLDIVLFLELGFAFGLEAMELNEEEVDERTERLQHPEQYAPAELWPLILKDIVKNWVIKSWQQLRSYRSAEWRPV